VWSRLCASGGEFISGSFFIWVNSTTVSRLSDVRRSMCSMNQPILFNK
jgi:hypothetical protein